MIENQIVINNAPVSVKEYNGQKVVTLKDIDAVHGRPDGTARKRFNENKKRFIQGEDYFVRKTDEAAKEYGVIAPNGLILVTESGYLMLVKSFTDDLAWSVQRQLVKCYFRVQETRPLDSYMISDPVKRAERWIEEQKAMQALEAKVQEQQTDIERMKPKEAFADAVADSDGTILIRDLAKLLKQNGVNTGEKKLYAWLRDNGYIIKGTTMPTQRAMEMSLFIVNEIVQILPDGTSKHRFVTKVTGKGQIYFLNKGKKLGKMDGER